jgi:hypothetical protein
MIFDYDVICVGGGLADSALAKVLAESGLKVLVLERGTAFRDRVRGEQMHPWGVAEAKRLGLDKQLMPTCANEVRYWSGQIVGYSEPIRRDLFATTTHRAGSLNFFHPDMQAVVIGLAEEAGATILRGVQVVELLSGSYPGVRIQPDQGCMKLNLGGSVGPAVNALLASRSTGTRANAFHSERPWESNTRSGTGVLTRTAGAARVPFSVLDSHQASQITYRRQGCAPGLQFRHAPTVRQGPRGTVSVNQCHRDTDKPARDTGGSSD